MSTNGDIWQDRCDRSGGSGTAGVVGDGDLAITSIDGHRGAYVSGEARQRLSLLKMLQKRRTCTR